MRKKVTIVGAGNVGATAAMRIAERDLADVVLIDILEDISAGKALDLMEAAPFGQYDSRVTGFTDDYSKSEDSHVVIITAGIPRRPGMSREDLLSTNKEIVQSVVREIVSVTPDSILIIVSNPLDAMCHVAFEASGFPKERVMGMAEAILRDKKKILPCTVYLEGEYGINNLFIGVPVKLGEKGTPSLRDRCPEPG